MTAWVSEACRFPLPVGHGGGNLEYPFLSITKAKKLKADS
jgi:hypothetical protein